MRHTHTLTMEQAIAIACRDIEQGAHGLALRAVQSPFDLSDAMRALLARLSAHTGNVTSRKVSGSPLPANEREPATT